MNRENNGNILTWGGCFRRAHRQLEDREGLRKIKLNSSPGPSPRERGEGEDFWRMEPGALPRAIISRSFRARTAVVDRRYSDVRAERQLRPTEFEETNENG